MTIIFDGKKKAKEIESLLSGKVEKLYAKGIVPTLAIILIGNDKASEIYVSLKLKAAERIGAKVVVYRFDENIKLQSLIQLIKQLNEDDSVYGIMIQMPLPNSLSSWKNVLILGIDIHKDVDGHKENSPYLPATVRAILCIFKDVGVKKGERVVVVGSQGEVGKRLLESLLSQGYSVSGIDKKDSDFSQDKFIDELRGADVIVSCTSVANLIKGEMVKEGAKIIDVGSPLGNVDFETVAPKTSFITPVPGGVGPMTVVSLLENLVQAACGKDFS